MKLFDNLDRLAHAAGRALNGTNRLPLAEVEHSTMQEVGGTKVTTLPMVAIEPPKYREPRVGKDKYLPGFRRD